MSSFGIEPTYASEDKLLEQYNNEEIDLYVLKDSNNYTIKGEDNTTTTYASSLVENYLNAYKQQLQANYLQASGIDTDEVLNIITITKDIKEQDNYFATYITSYAFLFIIMAITVSATYPATDATAGEKERGTLETLLTFPIRSKDIIIGKFLSVTISSIITGTISLILTIIALLLANNMFKIYEGDKLNVAT